MISALDVKLDQEFLARQEAENRNSQTGLSEPQTDFPGNASYRDMKQQLRELQARIKHGEF